MSTLYAARLEGEGVIADGEAFRMTDLAVSGRDVMEAAGIRPGPGVGMILRELLLCVVNGELPNDRNALLRSLRA